MFIDELFWRAKIRIGIGTLESVAEAQVLRSVKEIKLF